VHSTALERQECTNFFDELFRSVIGRGGEEAKPSKKEKLPMCGGGNAYHRPENRISTPGRILGPAWGLGQFGGARAGGNGAAGTIYKRN
jgi:hypothetical protein